MSAAASTKTIALKCFPAHHSLLSLLSRFLPCSIVLPQFFVSLVSSLIFAHFNHGSKASAVASGDYMPVSTTLGAHAEQHGVGDGSAPGVAWVLRFGGLAACVAALLTRLVPRTQRERDRLRESEADRDEDGAAPLLGDVGDDTE